MFFYENFIFKRDLKNLANSLASDIISDLNNLKEDIERQNRKITENIKENSLECAQRSSQLSRFIEDQIGKLSDQTNQKYEKTKLILTKIAEQFKNHLIIYEAYKKDNEKKISNLDLNLSELRGETHKSFIAMNENFERKINQEKEFLENLIINKTEVIEDKLLKLDNELETDVELIRKFIEENRNLVLEKLESINQNNRNFQQQTIKNLQILFEVIDTIKKGLKDFEEAYNKDKTQLIDKIVSLDSKIYSQLLAEHTKRNAQIQALFNFFSKITNDFTQDMKNFKILIENHQQRINFDINKCNSKVKESQDDLDILKVKMSKNELKIINIEESTDKWFREIEAENTLNKCINGAEFIALKEGLTNFVDSVLKQGKQSKGFQNAVSNEIGKIDDKVSELEINFDKQIGETVEAKMTDFMERIKRENNESWLDSVKKVQEGFNKTGNSIF